MNLVTVLLGMGLSEVPRLMEAGGAGSDVLTYLVWPPSGTGRFGGISEGPMRKCVRCNQCFADCDLTLAGDCASGSYHLCIGCADVVAPVLIPPSNGDFWDHGPGLHFGPNLGRMPWTNYGSPEVFKDLPKEK